MDFICYHHNLFQIRHLNSKLVNAEKCVEEQNQLIESKAIALNEKTRMIQERDEKCERLKVELQKLKKEIQVSLKVEKSLIAEVV